MRATRTWMGRLTVVLATAGVVAGTVAPPASAATSVVTKKTLAPGVVYQQINDPSIPIRYYVVTFDPGANATLDTVLSAPQIGTFQRTSSMAASAGALAAINGDLNDWPGRPTHQYVQDGMVMQTGARSGTSFAYRRDERSASVGYHPLHIWARNVATKATFDVASWNTDGPTTDQVVAYSPYGGKYEKPTTNQCSAKLSSPTALRWNTGQDGTGRDYKVEAVRCSTSTPMAVTAGSVVLSSKLVGRGATFLKSLKVGGTVHLAWSAASPGALDVVSGNAQILKGGAIQFSASCRDSLCGDRNPRTAIGVTATGRVILLVADGRSPGSVGLTLYQLARQMKALGAVDAVNLDGGGSATMWIKGLGVVNHPTDASGERPVSNAVVILPGADTAEPSPLAAR